MMRPTFFVLGAAKCGTTFLTEYLSEVHPDIYISEPKEPFFYEAEFDRGMQYYRSRYFSGWNGESAVGEARHRNLFLPYVPSRIACTAPDAKFIVLVRDPTDRAYSHWWHWYSRGMEKLDFEEAVSENIRRLEAGVTFEGTSGHWLWNRHLDPRTGKGGIRTYVDSGYYAEQIERYRSTFGSESVLVIEANSFRSELKETMETICLFLGVDPTVSFPDWGRRNMALGRTAMGLVQSFKKLGGRTIADLMPQGVVRGGLKFLSRLGDRPDMNPDTRSRLVEHYRASIEDLERQTEMDLSNWKTG